MTFKENQLKMRKMQQERMAKIKKQKRKETILTCFIILFIVLITIILLNYVGKSQQTSLNNCLQNGYSYNVCIKGA